MENRDVVFTEEMKKNYTILVPTMLPNHFKLVLNVLSSYGYNCELLENMGDKVKECGLKYVHNDTCYPALLVIGQMIDALESGRYDTKKVALLISQTGGGCRASNYISLLRKALEKAGFGYVPVISFNVLGMEKDSAFKLTLPIIHRLMYAVLFGDLIMLLKNQTKPYEITNGESDLLSDKWTVKLGEIMSMGSRIKYRKIKKLYIDIIRDFNNIRLVKTNKVKVGIVGEIFVKFSPLGNNNLEEFLLKEGAEVVIPGLFDFCLYVVKNMIMDKKLYGMNKALGLGSGIIYKLLLKKQNDIIKIISENSDFNPPSHFEGTVSLIKGFVNIGTKMGEGWLLTGEMLELIEQGTTNIVCTQPFGCLPNHIVGKGMMKPIKEKHPNVNIVAIDYDPSATKINQDNRIKLMLANASSKDSLSNEKSNLTV